MAEIGENTGGQHRSLSRKAAVKKGQIRVDMTPMVDLGFLLISFFMLTVVLDETHSIIWDKPAESEQDDVSECQVLNLLIDSNERIYTYMGLTTGEMNVTGFGPLNGVRQVIMQQAKLVKQQCPVYTKTGNQRSLICLIKLLPGARYKSMINVLDEMEITETQTYAIQEVLPEELEMVEEKQKLLANN